MVGALMMIMAAIKEKEGVEEEKKYTVLYVLVLILLPFSKSMGQLMTRKMRKMHENTISCFQQPIAVISCSIILYNTIGFDFIKDLSYKSYILFALMGTTTNITSALRVRAYKHCDVSTLAVYQYLSTPFQLTFDLMIFHNSFSRT